MNKETIAAIAAAAAFVAGFVVRWALPPARAVVDGEAQRAERDYQLALQDLERAKSTPGLDDDARAEVVAAARRRVRDRAARLKEALDAFPVG